MRKIAYLSLAAIANITIATTLHAQSPKENIHVTDLLKIKTIGDVHLDQEGTKAVFTLTSIEPDTTPKTTKWDYKYVTQLFIVSTDGATQPRQLTTRESATQPAWSPDGRQLAFVRTVDGKPQVFLLPFDGGEPTQLTHFRYGASSPKWSPDGKELLFSARINWKEMIKDSVLNPNHALPAWPIEQAGLDKTVLRPATAKPNPDGSLEEIMAYLDNDVTDKKAKVVTKLNFQDEMEVNPEMVFTEWFEQSLKPGATPVAVTTGFYNYNSVDYSPDGTKLVIVVHIDSTENPDRALESEIFMADRDGSHLHKLLGEKDKVFNNPRISPNGNVLAYTVSPTSFVTVPQVYIMNLAGNATIPTLIPFDRAASGFEWSEDNEYLYFTAQSNGGAPLYRTSLTTKKVEQLSDYNSGTLSFDLRAGRLVFARTEVADPSELYTADATMHQPKLLTAVNGDWLQHRQLVLPEKHSFRNSLGQTIEYWVMKPVGYTQGQRYPLLLDIHGGPAAMWGPGEASMWHEFQFFCAKGYGVVYCNPRGSGGYGLEFLRSNIKDWGTGPTSDVLTALDKTVAEGWADTSRLVVSGGSYAGYLVAWIVGHDHRFKAACAQRGVYDLATFFGEGNAWRLVHNYFGGYPWEPATKAILQHESPITYVANITTPLIIFHGESDRRTGFVQGEMLYRSLKVLGRPVEYVRHPGATHELTRSGDNRQRIDQMLRTWEFFQRYIR
ncbi:alpha/beta hydrolase family protein [Puia dinghuensis]|uniref:Peptidase S9 n=1 Tax=Puia dinghuensis TaxID=1792502 RepID=A0A8J2UBV1_9BACT|nr:S9 family peptidase [Puia dinghuensis]GGA95826.1 peptidase S9 [Puia dinghuensis]